MAELRNMPEIVFSTDEFIGWGKKWLDDVDREADVKKDVDSFNIRQAMNFASFIDQAFGESIAKMLGDIPVKGSNRNDLLPSDPDVVEVGDVRIVGGVRPQNYDAAYRADGPRIVFDSKTLNTSESIKKNWQNMINDLGTEATTIHTRFPYSIVVFFVVLPKPRVNE